MYSILLSEIRSELIKSLKTEITISHLKSIAGGCINHCFEFVAGNKKFFLKINSRKKFPGMFSAEKKGLELLSASSSLVVPLPVLCGKNEDHQYLLLTHLQKSLSNEEFFIKLGKGLAGLHKNSSGFFGLDHDNYIGSLQQINSPQNSFTEFFIQRRLDPQLKIAIHANKLQKKWMRNAEALFSELPSIIPNEKPALLHGDLWSGNVINSINGPAIFDPAVYYGHREADIAMTLLFGGFPGSFYEAYENEFALEKNWRARVELFNLYPLLVHVNLFGGSYIAEVENILRRFS
jgi:protein-ribulosamine 3-kinase